MTKHNFDNDKVLWFINTHLDYASTGTVAERQLFQILGKIKTLDPDHPAIVIGDFNIHPSQAGPYGTLNALFGDSTLAGFEIVIESKLDDVLVYDPRHEIINVSDATSSYAPSYQSVVLSDHGMDDHAPGLQEVARKGRGMGTLWVYKGWTAYAKPREAR